MKRLVFHIIVALSIIGCRLIDDKPFCHDESRISDYQKSDLGIYIEGCWGISPYFYICYKDNIVYSFDNFYNSSVNKKTILCADLTVTKNSYLYTNGVKLEFTLKDSIWTQTGWEKDITMDTVLATVQKDTIITYYIFQGMDGCDKINHLSSATFRQPNPPDSIVHYCDSLGYSNN